jgi:hypothetical protein
MDDRSPAHPVTHLDALAWIFFSLIAALASDERRCGIGREPPLGWFQTHDAGVSRRVPDPGVHQRLRTG